MTERVAACGWPRGTAVSGEGRLSAVMPMLLLAVCLLFSGCSAENPGDGEEAPERAEPENALAGNGLEYAGGFSINEFAGFRTLDVRAGVHGNEGLLSYLLLDPDLIIATALPPARRTEYNAIIDAGIPVVVVSEWLESSPLGRAEWVKLYAALFGKEQLAHEKFSRIREAYHGLQARTRDVADRPSVISGLPRKDAWFVPGGDSYVAALLRDAGASYHWSDLKTTGSIKMDIEPVYQVALDADFWLNPGTVLNLDELLSNDLRFRDFSSVQNGRVYNNNRLLNPAGGNAYWEFGVVQPERILKDLIMILHPDIAESEGFQDDSLTFYHLID